MTEDTRDNRQEKQQGNINGNSVSKHKYRSVIRFAVGIVLLGAGFMVGWYFYITSDIPRINTITDYKPPVITNIYGDDGGVIGQFFVQRRIPVLLNQMSKYIPEAFISAEDATFYQHGGVDYEAIFRAAVKDLMAGRIVQGGSTITQQLVKTLLLTRQKTITRKFKEFILATRLERHLTKKEILNIYLNQIYLGNGCYGVECASEQYFGKKATDISLSEAAILAGLPRSPNTYSPVNSPANAKLRQRYVLHRMAEQGYITKTQEKFAYNQPVKIYLHSIYTVKNIAPYFLGMLRQQLYNKYGQDAVLAQGLKVYTTIDPMMQKAAKKAVRTGIERIARKQGYPGPAEHLTTDTDIENFENEVRENELAAYPDYYLLTPAMVNKGKIPIQYTIIPGKPYHAVVIGFLPSDRGVKINVGGEKGIIRTANMRWAHPFDPDRRYPPVTNPHKVLKTGDVVFVRLIKKNKKISVFSLEPRPEIQGALVALDVSTGAIKAMVGGYNFLQSQYNHAVQAQRQVGSAFKPLYYAAALKKGYTPASVILDTPVVYQYTATTETGTSATTPTVWKPQNYDKIFTGPVTLQNAITHSRNNPSIRLLNAIGVNYAINFARRFGITEPLTDNLTLALGSSSISLLDLVSAYNVFPNYGIRVLPYYLKSVVDRNGAILEKNDVKPHIIDFKISSATFTAAALQNTAGTSLTEPSKYVFDPDTAYVMISMLKNVIQHGTGWRVHTLDRPAAGKTGTTEDNRDAWFIGFTPDIITGVWVGFDNNRSLGRAETGGTAAAPIWLNFMKSAVTEYPYSDFLIPPGVVFARMDKKTGYLATADDPNAIFAAFVAGTQPTQTAVQVNSRHGNEFFRFNQ